MNNLEYRLLLARYAKNIYTVSPGDARNTWRMLREIPYGRTGRPTWPENVVSQSLSQVPWWRYLRRKVIPSDGGGGYVNHLEEELNE